MSVSLSIHYRDTEQETRHIPVITYHDFEKYWKPIASQFGLEWVLLIQSAGIPIERHFDDLPTILDELSILKSALETSDLNMLESAKEHMLERIEVVITELNIIRDNPDIMTEVYLG